MAITRLAHNQEIGGSIPLPATTHVNAWLSAQIDRLGIGSGDVRTSLPGNESRPLKPRGILTKCDDQSGTPHSTNESAGRAADSRERPAT